MDDIVSTVLFCMLSVFIIASNLLVFVAVYRTPSLRTVSNFFLVSLAVADYFVGSILSPIYAVVQVTYAGHNHSLRVLQDWLWIQTVVTTTFNLTAISIDRYIAVTSSFRYTQVVTAKRCRYGAALIWIFAQCFATTRFLIHNPYALPMLWTATTMLAVFFPFLIISYCYFFILKAARIQRRQIAQLSSLNPAAHAAALKNKKAAYTTAIVIGLFALLWTPSLVLSFIDIAIRDQRKEVYIHRAWVWTVFVSFSSSAFNPWVYAVRNRMFRVAFKIILHL